MALLNIGDRVTIRAEDMRGRAQPPRTGTIAEYALLENKMQYRVDFDDGDEDWYEERVLLRSIASRTEV